MIPDKFSIFLCYATRAANASKNATISVMKLFDTRPRSSVKQNIDFYHRLPNGIVEFTKRLVRTTRMLSWLQYRLSLVSSDWWDWFCPSPPLVGTRGQLRRIVVRTGLLVRSRRLVALRIRLDLLVPKTCRLIMILIYIRHLFPPLIQIASHIWANKGGFRFPLHRNLYV